MCFTSMIIPLVSSNSSAHNAFKQNTHQAKTKRWRTQVFRNMNIFDGFYCDSKLIKALLFTFSVKLQILLPLYVDLFSLIIVSKLGQSNWPFIVVNFCLPNMMKCKHFPALSLTILLMESNLFRIPAFQC